MDFLKFCISQKMIRKTKKLSDLMYDFQRTVNLEVYKMNYLYNKLCLFIVYVFEMVSLYNSDCI